MTFRNVPANPLTGTFDEEVDSDAAMAVQPVKDADGNDYVQDGKVVYAYYLN